MLTRKLKGFLLGLGLAVAGTLAAQTYIGYEPETRLNTLPGNVVIPGTLAVTGNTTYAGTFGIAGNTTVGGIKALSDTEWAALLGTVKDGTIPSGPSIDVKNSF